jgi:RNA polymerase sigma factor (sigma-70 family)
MTAGKRDRFVTTHWSLVLAAVHRTSPAADDALAELCEIYWYPLYAHLRGRGYTSEDAQDLTQAFFVRVLEKRALSEADPARGRFRSFMLTAMKNFAANQFDRSVALKRGGAVSIIPLDVLAAEGRLQLEPVSDHTPETIFDRRWPLTLLERVIARLKIEARGRNQSQFDHLTGYLTGDEPRLSYAETAAVLGMSEGAVKVAVHRLRRRFRELVRAEIGQTVSSPDEVEDELRHLWSAVRR